MRSALVDAEPEPIAIDPLATALSIIDMQRDFLEPGGFGEALSNDVGLLAAAIAPCRSILEAARHLGVTVVHTREGHRPDLSDALPAKIHRGAPSQRIARAGGAVDLPRGAEASLTVGGGPRCAATENRETT